MSSSSTRIDRYVSLATLPTLAAAGTMGLTFEDAQADVVYFDVDITIGGFANAPEEYDFDFDGTGTARFVVGGLPGADSYVFRVQATDTKDATHPLVNFVHNGGTSAGGKTKKGGKTDGDYTYDLARFQEGALINGGAGQGFRTDATGAGYNPIVAMTGPFNGNGIQAGYVGFRLENGMYGYMDLSWNTIAKELTINAWAYEDNAGLGISAGAVPAPGAVGLLGLAMGASGMRRKRQH